MLITVTMNPCIDRTVSIDTFKYGGMNRIQAAREDASGKGVNVAIVYQALGGIDPLCTGINYTERGERIRERLDRLHIPHDFVTVPGAVRINLKILDQSQGVVTEVNEAGTPISGDILSPLEQKLVKHCRPGDMAVLSGSVPPGVPSLFYRDLMIRNPQVRWIPDAEGPLLAAALKARPFFLKPNLYELEKALGKPIRSPQEAAEGARSILSCGAALICVSMGGQGAVVVTGREAYYAEPLPIVVKSTVGAGDSMVAAFCLALSRGAGAADALRMGTAAASATAACAGTELCGRGQMDEFLPQVRIKALAI